MDLGADVFTNKRRTSRDFSKVSAGSLQRIKPYLTLSLALILILQPFKKSWKNSSKTLRMASTKKIPR